MYTDETLKQHLETQETIQTASAIYAEINMNSSDVISVVGNYRNRPRLSVGSPYKNIATSFIKDDPAYVGGTDSDTVIDGGVDTQDNPIAFTTIQTKKKLIYSLEDCFAKFRPRSGINKLLFKGNEAKQYTHHANSEMLSRPRYYIADKNDKFKYWTSFRTENGIDTGFAQNQKSTGQYYIDDAAPFVVYKEAIPTNRIVIKIQTHVGTYDIGSIKDKNGVTIPDPFYDAETEIVNRTVPVSWKIQYLDSDNVWQNLKTFTSATNENDIPIIGRDGYLELHYLSDGTWDVGSSLPTDENRYITDLVNPKQISGYKYEQFQFIKGLRLVVETMNKYDSTLDLIELSPRLAIDFTDISTEFSISKVASDLGTGGLPVGQLLASTGSLNVADFDQAFNENNIYDATTNPAGSIVAKYINKNIQFKFYEIIKNVEGYNYYVPLKTLYAEAFPDIDSQTRMVSFRLRDLYFYLESITAPQILLKNVSLSYAVAMVLDSIGFTNYLYNRTNNDIDPIIPFFFIPPDTNVAQILKDLAISTQTAMFFDEDNNFRLLSKNYLMPSLGDRENDVDLTLYGTSNSGKNGQIKNYKDSSKPLSNIKAISSKQNTVFNDGTIVYTSRYIQKNYRETSQANFADKEKVWTYKPVKLWEVTADQSIKSLNDSEASQTSYMLSAIPLNSNLSADLPTVQKVGTTGTKIINNVMDFGEGIYWLGRYNGYFYAGEEMIKFDAIEYNVGKAYPALSGIQAKLSAGSSTVTMRNRLTSNEKYQLEEVDWTIPYIIGNITQVQTPEIANVTSLVTSGSAVVNLQNVTNENMLIGQTVTLSNTFNNTSYYADLVAGSNKVKLVNGGNVSDFVLGLKINQTAIPNITGITSSIGKSGALISPTMTLSSVDGLYVGQSITKTSGDGVFAPATTIQAIDATAKTITVAPVPTTKGSITFTAISNNNAFGINPVITAINKEDNSITLNVTNLKTGPVKFTIAPLVGNFGSSTATIVGIDSVNKNNITLSLTGTSSGYIKLTANANNGGQFGTDSRTVAELNKTDLYSFPVNTPHQNSGNVVFDLLNPTGNVWISSLQEYQDVFSKLPFNAKMYPTGRVRIYAEPYYNADGTRVEGAVAKHGRGQFGTSVQKHNAGLDDYWTNNSNASGIEMDSSLLFETITKDTFTIKGMNTADTAAGKGKIIVSAEDIKKVVIGQLVTSPDGTILFADNTKVASVDTTTNTFTITPAVTTAVLTNQDIVLSGVVVPSKSIINFDKTGTVPSGRGSASGNSNSAARESIRRGFIRNYLSSSYSSDEQVKNFKSVQAGTVQSSALVMQGKSFETNPKAIDFISMVNKDLTATSANTGFKYTHFGTRMRIIGKTENTDGGQTPTGSTTYFTKQNANADESPYVSGASGGIAIMTDPEEFTQTGTNRGYFLEIAALSDTNISAYTNGEDLSNIVFYKIAGNKKLNVTAITKTGTASPYTITFAATDHTFAVGNDVTISKIAGTTLSGTLNNIVGTFKVTAISAGVSFSISVTSDPGDLTNAQNKLVVYPTAQKNAKAIPVVLWSGLASILVDDGTMVGQYRQTGDEKATVYDIAVEYQQGYDGGTATNPSDDGTKFFIYLNNKLVGTVVDPDPLPIQQTYSLFVRGSSKCMFEKAWAVAANTENGTYNAGDTPLRSFNEFDQEVETSFAKYKTDKTYVHGISPLQSPTKRIQLEEFGTIMREAAYFNVRYDKAYPALYSKLAPTFNKLQGYTVSGFVPGAYNAEFLVFNITDTALVLDNEKGNYLMITGITFTQESENQLKVDDYFNRTSNFAEIDYAGSDILTSKKNFDNIKNSRTTYGRNEFSLNAPYIQTQDHANNLMSWMISKIMKPRKSVGIEIFANPTIQLGDIVTIDYQMDNVGGIETDQIIDVNSRFVVYNIEYKRSSEGPIMTIYLSEVV